MFILELCQMTWLNLQFIGSRYIEYYELFHNMLFSSMSPRTFSAIIFWSFLKIWFIVLGTISLSMMFLNSFNISLYGSVLQQFICYFIKSGALTIYIAKCFLSFLLLFQYIFRLRCLSVLHLHVQFVKVILFVWGFPLFQYFNFFLRSIPHTFLWLLNMFLSVFLVYLCQYSYCILGIFHSLLSVLLCMSSSFLGFISDEVVNSYQISKSLLFSLGLRLRFIFDINLRYTSL